MDGSATDGLAHGRLAKGAWCAMQLQKLLTIPHARYGYYLIRNIIIKYKKLRIVTSLAVLFFLKMFVLSTVALLSLA